MEKHITTTLGVLVEAEMALARIASVRLPVKAAYHVAKLCTLVRAELRPFHEQRQAHIKELGEERDPTPAEAAQNMGQRVMAVTPKNWPEFERRMAELVAIEVSLRYGPIDLASFVAVEVSAGDLMALGPLVVFEEATTHALETQEGKSI